MEKKIAKTGATVLSRKETRDGVRWREHHIDGKEGRKAPNLASGKTPKKTLKRKKGGAVTPGEKKNERPLRACDHRTGLVRCTKSFGESSRNSNKADLRIKGPRRKKKLGALRGTLGGGRRAGKGAGKVKGEGLRVHARSEKNLTSPQDRRKKIPSTEATISFSEKRGRSRTEKRECQLMEEVGPAHPRNGFSLDRDDSAFGGR